MPRPVRFGRRGREHHRDVGRFGVGDPHLAAGQSIAEPVDGGAGLLVGGVGARIRFRERECAKRLPLRQRPEPALLLLVAAELGDDLGNERIVDGEDHGHRGARPRHGFEAERIAHVVETEAAPLLRNRDAEQAVPGGSTDDLSREDAAFVD